VASARSSALRTPTWCRPTGRCTTPNQGHVDSTDDNLREDPAIYHGPTVPQLQQQGLRVVPYAVDDEATMQRVIDLGVDGIISDVPERLQLVAERNGLK
jgi:glycerophosphoryl diester phosphodiesterase